MLPERCASAETTKTVQEARGEEQGVIGLASQLDS